MTHLSTLDVHRLHLGELVGTALTDAEGHLATCSRCQARLQAAIDDDAEVARSPLPTWLSDAPEAAAPAPEAPPTPAAWMVWLRQMAPVGVALSAAAMMLLMAVPALQQPVGEGIRTRGELPEIELWLKSDQGTRPVEVGEALGDGDQVQLFFDPQGAPRVGLAGRDSSGAIEVYRILSPTKEGLQPAPFGLTLDGAPGTQEFFVVAGSAGMDEAEVERAVREADPSVRRLVLPKEPSFP